MKNIRINSTRRSLLAGALGAGALGLTSRLSVAGTAAAPNDNRFVFVTFGGGPSRRLRSWKSESFVTMR